MVLCFPFSICWIRACSLARYVRFKNSFPFCVVEEMCMLFIWFGNLVDSTILFIKCIMYGVVSVTTDI
ncbi:hypothetical protein RJT34_20254 [Clitoria ternatea]|uniref:Uncharacterized protein n=1 Tax=Clitoria ternatea TaxID=43366 RepID=A0AAN9ISV3_CLITE